MTYELHNEYLEEAAATPAPPITAAQARLITFTEIEVKQIKGGPHKDLK